MAQEKRYLEYTDIDGVNHRVEISRDGINAIGVRRPDGSAEVGITYKNGVLTTVGTIRPGGKAAEAVINYENGVLLAVGTFRSNGSREMIINYENGVVSAAGAFRPDGTSVKAGIFYEDGRIDSMRLASSSNPEGAIKRITGISSDNPICR